MLVGWSFPSKADEPLCVRDGWKVVRGARPLTLHNVQLLVIDRKGSVLLLSAVVAACAAIAMQVVAACAEAYKCGCVRHRKL